jgi:predicted metalloendopeptidase
MLERYSNVFTQDIAYTRCDVMWFAVPVRVRTDTEWLRLFHRVLANYVMSRVAGASVNYLNDELRNRQLKFSTALSGKTEREARWKECIDIVSGG